MIVAFPPGKVSTIMLLAALIFVPRQEWKFICHMNRAIYALQNFTNVAAAAGGKTSSPKMADRANIFIRCGGIWWQAGDLPSLSLDWAESEQSPLIGRAHFTRLLYELENQPVGWPNCSAHWHQGPAPLCYGRSRPPGWNEIPSKSIGCIDRTSGTTTISILSQHYFSLPMVASNMTIERLNCVGFEICIEYQPELSIWEPIWHLRHVLRKHWNLWIEW